MFLGKYVHVLDDKGRITVPSKFRKELGKKVILSKGFDEDALILRSEKQFLEFTKELSLLSNQNLATRIIKRHIFTSSNELEIDSHGRINFPDTLIKELNIDKEITFAGMGDHCELWPSKKLEAHLEVTKSKVSEYVERSKLNLSEIEMVNFSVNELKNIKNEQNKVLEAKDALVCFKSKLEEESAELVKEIKAIAKTKPKKKPQTSKKKKTSTKIKKATPKKKRNKPKPKA